MKKPLKVALFSGLVFPGIGHIMLKKHFRAAILCSSFAISLYIYSTDVMEKADAVMQQVQNGTIALNANAIATALTNISTGLSQQQLSFLGYFMVLISLVSVVDSYRLAKKLPDEKVTLNTES